KRPGHSWLQEIVGCGITKHPNVRADSAFFIEVVLDLCSITCPINDNRHIRIKPRKGSALSESIPPPSIRQNFPPNAHEAKIIGRGQSLLDRSIFTIKCRETSECLSNRFTYPVCKRGTRNLEEAGRVDFKYGITARANGADEGALLVFIRSEERRVGKDGTS